MSEAAAPIEHVPPDVLPPLTPAQAAAFQDACAAAVAIHSARELDVIARLTEAPADPAAVATDCGLTLQGAEALLSALAGLDLLELGADGRFRPAHSGLVQLVELLRPWTSLQPVLRGRPRPANAATVAGAESLYPSLVSQIGALFRRSAERAAGAARAAVTPCARHRRRCCSLEPRHRRARAQFHRHSGGPAGGDEKYTHRGSASWIRGSV